MTSSPPGRVIESLRMIASTRESSGIRASRSGRPRRPDPRPRGSRTRRSAPGRRRRRPSGAPPASRSSATTACAVSSSDETAKSTSRRPSRQRSMYSTFDVRITIVARGASTRANEHATRLTSSRDVHAMKRSAVARPGLLDRPAARAVRLDRAEVVAVREWLEPLAHRVDHGEVVLAVKRLDDGRPDLPRTDDDDLHAAAEPTPLRPAGDTTADRYPRRMRGVALALVLLVAATAPARRSPRGPPRRGSSSWSRGLSSPVLRRAGARRARAAVRGRAAGPDPRRRAGTRASRRAFLDVRSLVVAGGEQGLLGLAFSPRYARDRTFYVNYTAKRRRVDQGRPLPRRERPGASRGARRRSFASSSPTRTTTAATSRSGPTASSGSGSATAARAATRRTAPRIPDTLLGKMFRLDVRQAQPTPELVGDRPAEPVALQLRPEDRRPLDRRRRPERDRGDRPAAARDDRARQLRLERVRGAQRYEDSTLGPGTLVQPVAQYTHAQGCSVTGGYVYRGKAVPRLPGATSSATTAAGRSGASPAGGGAVRTEPVRVPGLTSFGESLPGRRSTPSPEREPSTASRGNAGQRDVVRPGWTGRG